jgi:uncharacterized protein YndB with AHSA1/START domain
MPTARRSRTIEAPVEELWGLVCDPHHLPRWWPRVERVEDVEPDAFTEVMRTRKGKLVRADYSVVGREDAEHTLTWEQRLAGTPFAQVLSSAEIQLWLTPAKAPARAATATQSCEVTIELRQTMVGYSERASGLFMGMAPRLGAVMVRKAAAATLEEALDGLERIGA